MHQTPEFIKAEDRTLFQTEARVYGYDSAVKMFKAAYAHKNEELGI